MAWQKHRNRAGKVPGGDLLLPPARCGVGSGMALPRWGLKPPEEVTFQAGLACLRSGSSEEN